MYVSLYTYDTEELIGDVIRAQTLSSFSTGSLQIDGMYEVDLTPYIGKKVVITVDISEHLGGIG